MLEEGIIIVLCIVWGHIIRPFLIHTSFREVYKTLSYSKEDVINQELVYYRKKGIIDRIE